MHVGRSGPAGSVSGTATVELFLAGTFRVVRDGVQLTDGEIGSRKSRTLLKLLAVERPGLVTVDRIVEILWPDERPANNKMSSAGIARRISMIGWISSMRGSTKVSTSLLLTLNCRCILAINSPPWVSPRALWHASRRGAPSLR